MKSTLRPLTLFCLFFVTASLGHAQTLRIVGESVQAQPGSTVDVEFFASNLNPTTFDIYDYNISLSVEESAREEISIAQCGNTVGHPQVRALDVFFVRPGNEICFGSTFNFPVNVEDPLPPPFPIDNMDGLIRATVSIADDAPEGQYNIVVAQMNSDDTQFINDQNALVAQPYATTDAIINVVACPFGDLNGDCTVDANDIDYLRDNLDDLANDLNSDGIVDFAQTLGGGIVTDSDVLVRSILQTEYGDANLNRIVDIVDFSILNGSFDEAGFGWANGNFNADDIVDIVDFSILNGNFDFDNSSASVSSVPEPRSACYSVAMVALIAWRNRRSWF